MVYIIVIFILIFIVSGNINVWSQCLVINIEMIEISQIINKVVVVIQYVVGEYCV